MDEITARARRRTRAVLAAGALAVLAVVLVVVAVAAARHSPSAPPAAQASPSGATPPPATVPAGTPGPTVPAGDLSWTTVAGARLPVSRTAGPRRLHDGRASGFAHTPLGAVLAAAHLSVRLCPQAGPGVFGATLRDQVVGAGTAALARHLDEAYERARAALAVPYGQPAGRLYSTVGGFRVDAASAAAATVRLLLQGPAPAGGSVLVAVLLQLRWTGADWALLAPAAGDWAGATTVITDSTGYTRLPEGARS